MSWTLTFIWMAQKGTTFSSTTSSIEKKKWNSREHYRVIVVPTRIEPASTLERKKRYTKETLRGRVGRGNQSRIIWRFVWKVNDSARDWGEKEVFIGSFLTECIESFRASRVRVSSTKEHLKLKTHSTQFGTKKRKKLGSHDGGVCGTRSRANRTLICEFDRINTMYK